MSRYSLVLAILALGATRLFADDFVLQDKQRVVFLGDSNTFAGRFIAYMDAYLYTRFPDKKFELINLGLPSETVSGQSEPDHPYPRPCVFDRLERALKMSKPDVVVACYGMNDGIYYPFSEERFKKYQEGYRKLIDAAKTAGAKVVLMTPAPFDPLPLKDKVLAEGAEKYSWMRPFKDYDKVLTRFADWQVSLRKEGFIVADAHAALLKHLETMRKDEPTYRVSGDGIHPDANGHGVIARTLLQALSASAAVPVQRIDLSDSKLPVDATAVVKPKLPLPMPLDPKWHKNFVVVERMKETLNDYRLVIRGLTAEQYELYENDRKLGTATGKQLAEGLDLLSLPELSTNRRALDLWKLLEERQKTLGLAWLTEVGHNRPDTPKGLPLAEAEKKAQELEARARELAKPREVELRLSPK